MSGGGRASGVSKDPMVSFTVTYHEGGAQIQPGVRDERTPASPAAMIVGVLSDTHGLLRPAAIEALRGADLLLHAGDVGDLAILDELERIAPLHAVRGNTDWGQVGDRLPLDQVVQVEGCTIYMKHIAEEIDIDPEVAGFDVVVTGHTHRPEVRERDGVIHLNPGSCGPRRFDLPVTVARLRIDEEVGIQPEILHLSV